MLDPKSPYLVLAFVCFIIAAFQNGYLAGAGPYPFYVRVGVGWFGLALMAAGVIFR